jgi:hypothetical protein
MGSKGRTAPRLVDQGAAETTRGAGTVAVVLYPIILPPARQSHTKRAIMAILATLWHHQPALGVALGRAVLACWPGFRGA